jgi:hypothetical protein
MELYNVLWRGMMNAAPEYFFWRMNSISRRSGSHSPGAVDRRALPVVAATVP